MSKTRQVEGPLAALVRSWDPWRPDVRAVELHEAVALGGHDTGDEDDELAKMPRRLSCFERFLAVA